MYYFFDWRETEDGRIANLPDEIDYIMLAEPSSVSDYALFECIIPDEYEESEFAEPVSDSLYDLLNSAKSYPPALALTRNEVRNNAIISRTDFAEKLVSRLEFHLENQRTSPYFMARKINRSATWNSKGEFCWIVGYKPKNNVDNLIFVSDDYYICHASVEDFEVEIKDIEKRFLK